MRYILIGIGSVVFILALAGAAMILWDWWRERRWRW